MSASGSLGEFLRSRRARLDPDAVGLPRSPIPRRGQGLRREEVATLAGVSVDYYARLEQGRVGNVSDQVLSAVSDALRLDSIEREHLRTLVGTALRRPRKAPAAPSKIRVSLRRLIEAMDPIPAFIQGPRAEVLAWNRAATVLLTDFGALSPADRNIARWLFLDPVARVHYPDWEEVAASTVAAMRASHDPGMTDEALESLVGEPSVASADFARYWADYRLLKYAHGMKRIVHPSVGEMRLNFETFPVPDSPGQTLVTYAADVGSPSEEKLRILMSWGAESPESAAPRSELRFSDG